MPRYFILLSVLLSLAACETAKGVGRDVESAGEALQEEAAEDQAQM